MLGIIALYNADNEKIHYIILQHKICFAPLVKCDIFA